jgi:hypothetical protein
MIVDWHSILGYTLIDYFINTRYSVTLEKELEIKQKVDILVIEEQEVKNSDVISLKGFENLGKYNAVTYKSLRQPLDSWVLDELTSYYVLFRKIISPDLNNLVPEQDFKLYGIATRFPEKLNKQEKLEFIGPGVYQIRRGVHKIKIIVICELPREQGTELWQMFSTRLEMVEYGMSEYKWKNEEYRKSVLNELRMKYKEEDVEMSYTDKDWFRDVALDHIGFLTPDERLQGLRPEERLQGLRPDERLQGLRPEEIKRMKSYLNSIQM